MADVASCKFRKENQSKASEYFAKSPWLKMTKAGIVHINNMQINKMNIIQHRAEAFYRKYSDITPFVILNIFISNCNLVTHYFSVTITNYS